ncbi:hypothetical protein [Azospirillum doebereinerae]
MTSTLKTTILLAARTALLMTVGFPLGARPARSPPSSRRRE